MKERGMMKWKPFISMVEQQQAVYQVLNELQKIEKPMLDESQHEQNSRILLTSFYSGQQVEIVYYEQGMLNRYKGNIEKVNEAYRYLILNESGLLKKKLTFDCIIEVQLTL